MADTTSYKTYATDEAKAKRYNRRILVADADFNQWKDLAKDWWARYENHERRNQQTPKGHRVNTPAGVATIDALYSSMTAIDISVHVLNIGPGDRDQADLATAALAKEWELAKVQQEADSAVKDALVASIGWVKVGYEYVESSDTVPRAVDAVRDDILALIKQASTAEEAGMEGVPDIDTIAANVPVEEEQTTVLRDRIVVDFVPYDMIRVDPTAKRMKDVAWVAQITKVRVEDAKENQVWKEYVSRTKGGARRLEELKGTTTFETDRLPEGAPTADETFAEVIEMTDFETGTVCTFVKGQDWLLNETVNPFMLNYEMQDRSPFVPLVLRATNTRLRGISDMELLAPSLDEQSVYRSATATFIERFVPKVIGPEDALTEEGKAALSNSEYGAYVSIAREYAQDGITPLVPPTLPSEAFQMEQRIEDSMREATGVNELMRGLFPDRKRTATETSEVVSASAARQSEKRNTLTDFYEAIATRMLQLMQQFYTQERMVKYVDTTYGQVEWQFTAEDIVEDYALDIELTPKEAVTAESKRQDAMALFNFLVPGSAPGPDGSSTVDAAGLYKWFLEEAGVDRQSIFDILNLPEEQQAQQLAAQQATAGMASAAQGQPQPGMTTGPLNPNDVAALTNQGQVPPETAVAAQGIGPTAPEAAQIVGESKGVSAGPPL